MQALHANSSWVAQQKNHQGFHYTGWVAQEQMQGHWQTAPDNNPEMTQNQMAQIDPDTMCTSCEASEVGVCRRCWKKGQSPKRDAIAESEVVQDSVLVIAAPQENIPTMPQTLANCELCGQATERRYQDEAETLVCEQCDRKRQDGKICKTIDVS